MNKYHKKFRFLFITQGKNSRVRQNQKLTLSKIGRIWKPGLGTDMLIDIVLQNRLLLQQNSLLQMSLSALSVMVCYDGKYLMHNMPYNKHNMHYDMHILENYQALLWYIFQTDDFYYGKWQHIKLKGTKNINHGLQILMVCDSFLSSW